MDDINIDNDKLFDNDVKIMFNKRLYSSDLELELFHHYEEYNPNKEYEFDSFEADYGHGKLIYHNYLYVKGLYDKKSDSIINKKYYIISREEISNDECNELAKHCQCEWHKMWKYNPLRYFTCKCYVGCLEYGSEFTTQWVIDDTKKYIKKYVKS